MGELACEAAHRRACRAFVQGQPGSIQQANRPGIRSVQGKFTCQLIKAGAALRALTLEPHPQRKDAFHNLGELKLNAVNPLLLELYDDYEAGLFSKGELLVALRRLEA